jgi:hypothetical protein
LNSIIATCLLKPLQMSATRVGRPSLRQNQQKAQRPKAPLPNKVEARPKVATKKVIPPAKAKRSPAKAAAKRGTASQMKASEPASTPTDETTKPNESVTV